MIEFLEKNWVAIVCCIPVVVVFLLRFRLLYKIEKSILTVFENIKLDALEKTLSNCAGIKDIYDDYKSSMVTFGQEMRTREYADEYFSEDAVLAAISVNNKQISSTSGMLVGLGLLGTFFGLTIGIASFESDSSEAIQQSIQSLLGGMSTAFWTSLIGMALSCIYIAYEKYCMYKFHVIIEKICAQLDRRYFLSDTEFVSNYLSYKDEHGNVVLISNAVRDVYAEVHKQSGYMGTLVDDLSEALDEKFSNSISEKVIPALEKLSENLDSLKSQLRSPAEDLTRKVVDELQSSMQGMMEKFGESLSGTATEKLTLLAGNLNKTSEALKDLPSQMKNMSDKLGTAFGGIHSTISDLESAVKKIVEQSVNSNKNLIEQTNNQVGQIAESHQRMYSQTDALIGNFNNMVETLNATVKEVQGAMIQIRETKDSLGGLVVSIRGITDNMEQASTQLKSTQEDYVSGLKEVQDKSAVTVSHIANSLQLSKDTLADYSNKFATIQQGLTSIFAQIQKGLDQYTTSVSQGTKSVLSGYTSALNEGVEKLQQAVSYLNDVVDEMNSTIKDIQKMK